MDVSSTDFELASMLATPTDNLGTGNTGTRNRGDFNSGDENLGHFNSGGGNLGFCNSGSFNVGIGNSGDSNAGEFNSGGGSVGNYHAGFFCVRPPRVSCFDAPTRLTHQELLVEYPEATQLLYRLGRSAPIPFKPFSRLPGITPEKLTALHQRHLAYRLAMLQRLKGVP